MKSPKLQNGLEQSSVDELSPKLNDAKSRFIADKKNLGFTKLPLAYDDLKNDLLQVDKLAEGMESVVVIGIGGSDLGTRAIFKALKEQYYNEQVFEKKFQGKRLYFAGDTTDPESISDLVDVIDLAKTLFLVVSKSGNTVEQASVFIYFRDLVIQKLGEGSELMHFVFLTDSTTGTLRKLADEKGYRTISIPSDVGGRFSVLSSVGLVPAHLVGLNVEEFLKGASEIENMILNDEAFGKSFLEFVGLQYLYYKAGKNISVLMPYQYSLFEFAKWYRQLWAESLGKRLDVDGKEVFEGITPIAALGPTDQHSQLQLYNEGPNDKIFTFITAENSRRNLNLPGTYKDVEAFDFLQGHSFHEILTYEQQTTAFALTKNQRPNATISISQVDEYHLGQLFYFYELAVTFMGYLLNVNTFDQPGVELSKNAMYGVLGKQEYIKEKEAFENYLAS